MFWRCPRFSSRSECRTFQLYATGYIVALVLLARYAWFDSGYMFCVRTGVLLDFFSTCWWYSALEVDSVLLSFVATLVVDNGSGMCFLVPGYGAPRPVFPSIVAGLGMEQELAHTRELPRLREETPGLGHSDRESGSGFLPAGATTETEVAGPSGRGGLQICVRWRPPAESPGRTPCRIRRRAKPREMQRSRSEPSATRREQGCRRQRRRVGRPKELTEANAELQELMAGSIVPGGSIDGSEQLLLSVEHAWAPGL